MKIFLKKNLIKKLCLIIFIIYIMIVFANQQKKLIAYNSQKAYYLAKISDAKKSNDTLIEQKDDLDSDEYIETVSREKLDMYSNNERVYININK